MSSDIRYNKGSRVDADEYGLGEVVLVDTATGEDGPNTVYHVRLDSGDTRHFTEDQLSVE